MRLTAVRIKGYRSVRQIRFPVGPLTVFVGRNGVGKTNLYRALALLHAAAKGTITREIALEGGMGSVLWAGKERKSDPRRLILSAEFDDLEYAIEIGLPAPAFAALAGEPLVKVETLTAKAAGRPVTLMERKGAAVWLRDEHGRRRTFENVLLPSETTLATFRDAERFTELFQLRLAIQDWRLYHEFRADSQAPARRACLAITTPTLSSDGNDLAAVFATVVQIRQEDTELAAAVDDAFPGARLAVTREGNRCGFTVTFADLDRPFSAHELSDGTLKYLCLVGALCGYRMPGFIALNEPEASLHPDLIAPLARLIVNAADRARVWVVTHSDALGAEIERLSGVAPRQVVKREAETWIDGLSLVGEFRDEV